MKKIILLICISLFFLSACSSSITDEESEISDSSSVTSSDNQGIFEGNDNSINKTIASDSSNIDETMTNDVMNESSWEHFSSIYPTVTYDDIKSGIFPDQYVILPVTIESAEYNELMNWMECDAWFSHENTYQKDNLTFDLDNFNLDTSDPKTIKSEDNIDICVYVNKDNSFGGDIISFNMNDNSFTLDEIQNTFKRNCQPLNYTDILRNPDSVKGTTFSLSGSVFQIIKQEDNIVEFLLYTGFADEYVKILYFYKNEDARILENDKLTVYGTFYVLYDYVSTLGTNHTIPQISAEFIENNSIQ